MRPEADIKGLLPVEGPDFSRTWVTWRNQNGTAHEPIVLVSVDTWRNPATERCLTDIKDAKVAYQSSTGVHPNTLNITFADAIFFVLSPSWQDVYKYTVAEEYWGRVGSLLNVRGLYVQINDAPLTKDLMSEIGRYVARLSWSCSDFLHYLVNRAMRDGLCDDESACRAILKQIAAP